jgi:PKD repeat protein
MKKIYLLILSVIVITAGIGVYISSNSITYKKPPKRTRIDEAIKWDNFMKQDPALGYVPHERMFDVYRRIDELNSQASSRTGDLANAKWRDRGPFNVGGRTRIIMIDRNDTTGNTIFAAGVTGGLWKSTNIADTRPTWDNIGDFFSNINVCALAQDPNNFDVMYFGTGEPHGGAGRGLGIWKSTNGGDSWTHLPTTANSSFHYVVRLFVHPVTSHVYAATETGLFKSQDAGATWTKVLGSGVSGGFSDAITDLEYGADGRMYISMGHNGGSSSVFVSPSGATQGNVGSWTWLTNANSGFPTGQSRIELAVAPSNENILYALGAQGGDASGIYKSSNKGVNWTKISNPPPALGMGNFANGQAWYDLEISVDPTNPNIVVIGGIDLLRSTNGGNSWDQISQWFGGGGFQYVHADQHFAIWDKNKPGRVFFGNDGGVWLSENRGVTMATKNFGYNVTQFYAHAMHPDKYSNYFLAGAQDNGSQQFDEFDIANTEEVLGGDGFMCHIDQDQPDTQFVSLYYGDFHFTTDGGQSFGSIRSGPIGSGFYTPSDYDNDGNILYTQSAGNGSFFRWEVKDLGNNEGETVNVTGFTGFVTHIYASDNVANRIYIGSTAGRIYKIDNANTGTTVSSVALNLPTGGNISCIVEADGDPNHLVVTLANYGINSIWRTTNGGINWVSIEGNLPDVPVNWVVFHPYDNDKLFIATDAGVWVTEDVDGGNTAWDISSRMPVVRTDMLQTRKSDGLISAGTHGRGVFSTDFLSPVVAQLKMDRVGYLQSPPNFKDFSINSQKWLWNFGDGTTSALENPTHTYSTIGTYNVSLTINDTATTGDIIKILPDRPVPYTAESPIYGGSFDAHLEDFGVDNISGTGWEKGASAVPTKSGTHSGTSAYVTGLNDLWYKSNSEAYLYTPNFDLSEPAIYEFKFWGKYNIQQGFDGLQVEYSLDRGKTWKQLGDHRNDIDEDLNNWYNYTSSSATTAFTEGSSYFTGYQPSWKEFKTDLNALVGNSNVAFRFAFKTNASNNQSGVAIDDIQVTKYNDILETVLRSFEGSFKTPSSDEVILDWSTQPEYLCKGFTYFISSNGKDFIESSTFIAGQGSTADLTSYSTNVFNMSKNLYYFQLKVISLDNSYFMSDIIVLNRDGEDADLDINIFPNPIGDNFNISFNQSMLETSKVFIYDSAGRLVLYEEVEPGRVFTNIGTAKLASGVYVIVLEAGEQRVVKKVIKMD